MQDEDSACRDEVPYLGQVVDEGRTEAAVVRVLEEQNTELAQVRGVQIAYVHGLQSGNGDRSYLVGRTLVQGQVVISNDTIGPHNYIANVGHVPRHGAYRA